MAMSADLAKEIRKAIDYEQLPQPKLLNPRIVEAYYHWGKMVEKHTHAVLAMRGCAERNFEYFQEKMMAWATRALDAQYDFQEAVKAAYQGEP